jgi:hypothetical protein
MSGALLEQLMLPARPGLRFLDAYSGRAIVDGLRCTLYHRRDRRALGVGVVTPSGVHHWPELAAPWRREPASPPLPQNKANRCTAPRWQPCARPAAGTSATRSN